MAFRDVAIYFLREEWQLLDDSQRRLYHHVMMEVFVLMSSSGKLLPPTQSILSVWAWILFHRETSPSQIWAMGFGSFPTVMEWEAQMRDLGMVRDHRLSLI